MSLKKSFLALLVATATAWACTKGASNPEVVSPAAPSSAAGSVVKSSAGEDFFISEEDRKWWKTHVPQFSVDNTTITVSGTNPWDHSIRQGHAVDLWLKVFIPPGPGGVLVAQSGPFRIGAKETFTRSVDIGKGSCLVEVELRLDSADGNQPGGTPYLLFGAFNLEVPGCKTPRPRPSPSPGCVIKPLPTDEGANASTVELPYCDLCDNLEGNQQEIPEGLERSYDEETGQFVCLPPNCPETWAEQEPLITYGEWGECTPNISAATHPAPQTCSRSREVLIIINELNACSQTLREKSRETRTESEPCECPCFEDQKQIRRKNLFTGEWGEWQDATNFEYNTCIVGIFCERRIIQEPCD